MTFLVAILPGGLPDPTMPLPDEIEVMEGVRQITVYRLRYTLSLAEGDLPLLLEPRLGPEAEIAIQVPDGDATAVLVKGPVTAQRIHLRHGVGGSKVDVLGADYCVALNRENKARLWPGPSDSAAVAAVLADQPDLMLMPDVAETSAQHTEDKHLLVQRETDLQFVRRLADRNGYWFWLDYAAGPAGPSAPVTAHFKPPPADETPAIELKLNVAEANIDSIEIEWDVERPASMALSQLDLGTRSPITASVSDGGVTGLADQDLAAVAAAARVSHFAVPVDDGGDLDARGRGALQQGGWFVQARVSAKANVLKKVVRAHTVVQLTGAGSRHSGKYLVWSVTHLIKDGEHAMDIALVRNGWN